MSKYSAAVARDSRFKHVLSDPRFKRVPKHERKLKVDSRFKRMFTDKSFKVKYLVDKRGRNVDQTSSEDLTKYYQLADDEREEWVDKQQQREEGDKEEGGSEEEEEEEKGGSEEEGVEGSEVEEEEEEEEREAEVEEEEEKGGSEEVEEGGSEEEGEEGASEEEEDWQGKGAHFSSSDTDDDGPYSETQDNAIEHEWMEMDRDCTLDDQTSRRLAVCNVDWDRISAKDLYVLVNSFVPSGGIVKSVKVYPSDYGRERMAYEDVHGPAMPKGTSSRKEEEEEEDEEVDDEESCELLRKYQLERLRYYYAVVECDSITTAEHLYEQCNGMEYEASSAKLDLRFIPDDMTFDDQKPSSVASDADTLSYVPSQFITSALQQSTVRLTWDETDPRRLSSTMKKYSKEEALDADLRDFLASSSSDSEFEEGDVPKAVGNGSGDADKKVLTEEERLEAYKQLVSGAANKSDSESDVDMQITWEPGLKNIPDAVEQRRREKEKTTWETYLEERKEKKKKAKKDKVEQTEKGAEDEGVAHESELELVMMGEEDEGREHFSLKAILDQEKPKRKGKKKRDKEQKKEQESFQIDLADPRFSAMYESAMFAVDPSHPQYKATKSMAAMVTERQKRKQQSSKRQKREVSAEEEEEGMDKKKAKQQEPSSGEHRSTSHELQQLVKSIKSKANTKRGSRMKRRGHMTVM